MAETTPSGGSAPALAAANAVAPDPLTANLLAKHSAGEKLTPSEYGKLGAFKAKLKQVFGGKGGAPGPGPQPAQPAAVPGNPPPLGALAPAQASPSRLDPVPVDPGLAKRTTAAILNSADTIARRYVGRQARKAGADDKTVARFDSAAALPVATKELMVDVSPDVLAELGIDPHSYPIVTFLGGLGLWSANLWLCVDELKAMQKKDSPAPATHTIEPRRTLTPPPPPS